MNWLHLTKQSFIHPGVANQGDIGIIQNDHVGQIRVLNTFRDEANRSLYMGSSRKADRYRPTRGHHCCLAGFELHEYPAGGPINGNEQVAAGRLVQHWWQVVDVKMKIARIVSIERLVGFQRDNLFQITPTAYSMVTQAAVQPGA